jgi:hypothetical protein
MDFATPQVVVVAEDGVTSSRYPIVITRLPNPAPPPPLASPPSPGSRPAGRDRGASTGGWIDAGKVVTYEPPVSSAEQRRKGGLHGAGLPWIAYPKAFMRLGDNDAGLLGFPRVSSGL